MLATAVSVLRGIGEPPDSERRRRETTPSAPDLSPLRIRPRPTRRRSGLTLHQAELGEHPETASRGLGAARLRRAADQGLAQLLPTRLTRFAQVTEDRDQGRALGQLRRRQR